MRLPSDNTRIEIKNSMISECESHSFSTAHLHVLNLVLEILIKLTFAFDSFVTLKFALYSIEDEIMLKF